MRRRTTNVLGLMVVLALILACVPGTTQEVESAFNEDYVSQGLGEESPGIEEEIPLSSAKQGNHELTASFILQQAGLESDLSTYKDAYLLKYSDEETGEERFAVHVDGKTVFPEAAK